MKRIASLVLTVLIMVCGVFNFNVGTYAKETPVKRYTVLVLDTSNEADFMSGGKVIYTAKTALEYVKKASLRFIDDVSEASGTNYIAIVSYKDNAAQISGFSDDYDLLKSRISGLRASSNIRDISAGLSEANSLISSIDDDNAVKNVVLFTTGMTNNGSYKYEGKYDSSTIGSRWFRMDTGVKLYAYANVACEQADIIKESDTSLYSIGIFQTYENMPSNGKDIAEFFQLTAKDLATSEDYFYPVDDPDKLEFTFGEVARDITNELKKITFTYQSGNDYEAECWYTNDYFSESSYTYNASLATMSLSFATSAFGSAGGDYSDKSRNARKLLQDIGMESDTIDTNEWFTQKPTTDSIGVVSGNMPIRVNGQKYTLIALAVRGGGYEQEWASNFTMGYSGQHQGFNEAKNNVIDYLKNYIEDQEITGPVKIWITGYSRAAATANLVGGAIDDGEVLSEQISYSPDDVYTYCFETPAGAVTSEVKGKTIYNNIFNIINKNDPVPYVAPAVWGFGRYGIDRYLPSAESSGGEYYSLRSKMLDVYNSLPSTDTYIVDDFQMKKLGVDVDVDWNWFNTKADVSLILDDANNNFSQGVFLSNYVTILARDFFESRSSYAACYEDEIREICSVVFGCTNEQSRILLDSIKTQAVENWGSLAWSYFYNTGVRSLAFWNWGNWGEREDEALQIVSDWLNTAIEEAGITDYDADIIDRAGKDIGDLALALISNHPNYFTTAVVNGSSIATAHYPELCYSWLASMDENYSEDAEVRLNNGDYRIIRINCDVNVRVYDSEMTPIAEIIDNIPVDNDTPYLFGVDENDQKYVILPIDSSYTIEIIANEDGTVNYGISEFSALAGDYTRNINYFDIRMKKGDVIKGIIPAYNAYETEVGQLEGSTTEYALLNAYGDSLMASSDLSGAEALNAYYKVTAVSAEENYGAVTGTSTGQYGQFVKLEAHPYEGYEFIGWYVGDERVSTDESYRVCVTQNETVTGRFAPAESEQQYSRTDETGEKGDTDKTIREQSVEIPNTGDSSEIMFYNALLCASGILMVTAAIIKKRYKYTA